MTTPDPKRLNPGVLTSSITIRNCGTDTVDWTAATVPSVALDDGSGTLAGGADHVLGFTIDGSGFADDDIAFKVKVSEPGFNQYVDVEARKAGLADPGAVGPDPQGTITTGGPDGCAATCITRASLTPNASTPNLALDVETSTPAQLAVFVSTDAPAPGEDGLPAFPDGGLIAVTDDLHEVWSAVLAPLEPDTDYHIIVRATDADGGVEHRVGTFRTTSPAVDPELDAAAPGGPSGCATQCITKAWLTPDPASFDMELEVQSHTLARFEVFVSTEPLPTDPDGRPLVDGLAPTATNYAYEMAWTTTLGPLEPSTAYHVVVEATDGMFRSSFEVGTFETRAGAEQMIVAFHRVHVHVDGDRGANRGELTLAMTVDGEHVATTAEHKVSSGDTVHLSDGDRSPGINAVVDFRDGPGGFLPQLWMTAFERDADWRSEPCFLGDFQPDAGRDDGCDMKWDVASSGLVASAGFDSLLACAELGVDDASMPGARCTTIASPGDGDDVPRITAVVSFQKVPG